MKKNNKGMIIFIGILIVYLLIMYVLVGRKTIKEKNASDIFLIHYNTKFYYNDYKWHKIENDDYLKFNGKKYDVYQNKTFFGNYELMFNKKWYMFNENSDSIDFEDELFAYNGKEKIKFIEFEESNLDSSDSKNLQKALTEVGIEDYKGFFEGKKITMNIDKDGKEEIIYIASGSFDQKVFAITFLYDNSNIKIIDSDVLNKEDSILLKFYKFHSIIDIGNDNKYEVIISQDTFGEHIPYCHYMLYNGREVDVVTSCESR